MSFTNAEKVQIRTYMGWPAFATSETILEGAMDLVGADVDGAAYVRAILVRIASIETEIAGLHPIALADKVEESSLNPDRYRDLRTAGRREVRALAICFRVTPIRDIFGIGWPGGFMAAG